MKQSILALVATLFGYAAFAQYTNAIIDDYMSIKNALVIGDSKATANAVSAFHQKIKEGDTFKEKEALLKAVENMSKAGDIEKQRAAFNEVSVDVWKIVEKAEKTNNPVYYQYCPMKKSYWLSREKEIKNPYYGSAMLNCGTTVQTKL